MRILILEIANGIANQSQVHDQHKPSKRKHFNDNIWGGRRLIGHSPPKNRPLTAGGRPLLGWLQTAARYHSAFGNLDV